MSPPPAPASAVAIAQPLAAESVEVPQVTSAPSKPAPSPSPSPLPSAPPSPHVPRAPAAPSSSAAQGSAADDVVAEEDLLHRARAELTTSPSTALALTDAHARRFPQGALVQEREVLAIDALGRLGRTEEASARAYRFRARWPDSPYVRELHDRGLIE